MTKEESSYEDAWGGPNEARALAAEAWSGFEWAVRAEAPGLPPPLPRRHRLPATLLRALAYAATAVALFIGGWWARGALEGEPSSSDELMATVFREEGVTLDVRWGDLPRRLAQNGVIDVEKFTVAAENAGSPLTAEQLRMLANASDAPLRIDADNAYFVLDVLWALGLANKNPILTEGPLAQKGQETAARYASTGGWTIGARPGPEYLAGLDLVNLTPKQQAVVEEVAFNSYRPCCGNMTAFPDCNHGMAALALTELMASQGATADDIFEALKKVSPFWFPEQYHHLATYFQGQDQQWDEVDPRLVMGNDYSSASGWQRVNAWLLREGLLTDGRPGGGKAGGCAP